MVDESEITLVVRRVHDRDHRDRGSRAKRTSIYIRFSKKLQRNHSWIPH